MATNAAHQASLAHPSNSGLIGYAADKGVEVPLLTLTALQLAEQGLSDVRNFLEGAKKALTGEIYDGRLSDPHRLARREMRRRQLRNALIGDDLFSDPAWDILLLLFAERPERPHLLIRDFSVMVGVPVTTVLRWLAALETKGLVWRRGDERDRRAANVGLTEKAVQLMTKYFAD